MSIARNIAATYRGPQRVFQNLYAQGPREASALAYLMAGCGLLFVARMPSLAREAHLDGTDLNAAFGGALMGLIFIAPLLFYGLAFLAHLIARAISKTGEPWQGRVALFWSLLASTPLVLLNGLVAGFIGNGIELSIVGAVWLAAFLLFWATGMVTAYRKQSAT